MTAMEPTPEFSVEINLESIGSEPCEVNMEAGQNERAALSRRFGLISVDSLSAKLRLKWLKPGRILLVSGQIAADVQQSCVVTLNPIPAKVTEDVEIIFARASEDTADIIDPKEVEPLESETLDLGEMVSAEMLLALDPYPRDLHIDPAALKLGPDVSLINEEEMSSTEKRANPFEILAELQPKS